MKSTPQFSTIAVQRAIFTPIFLALLFVCSLQVLRAQTDHLDPDGNRLINFTTIAQLNAIRYDINGNGYADRSSDNDSYGNLFDIIGRNVATDYYEGYELMNDLDLETSRWASAVSTTGWVPIGSSRTNSFTATFEGNGHTISNLYINNTSTLGGYVGLFGYVGSGAEIRNLRYRRRKCNYYYS